MSTSIEGMLPTITVDSGFVVFVHKDGSRSWTNIDQATEYAERIVQATNQIKYDTVPTNRKETT